MPLDIDQLLNAISDDAPSGELLEDDAAFLKLEDTSEFQPERQMGDEVLPAEPPNWRDVRSESEDLLARTKDLRVAVWWTQAALGLDGLAGFAAGLELIRRMLADFWDTVHPELDADDDNDPMLRMNSLLGLTASDAVLRPLHHAPLVSSNIMGTYSLRHIEMAAGKVPPMEDEDVPDAASIEGAFQQMEEDAKTEISEAATGAKKSLEAIGTFLDDKIGAMATPNMDALSKVLASINRELTRRLEGGVDEEEELEGVEAGGGGGGGAVAAPPGAIRGREDVIRTLDRVCDYFKRNEPSSPVPFLLDRAKRLTTKNFMEIVQDMAPEGIEQVEMVSGVKLEDDE